MTLTYAETAADSVRDLITAAMNEAGKGHSPELHPGHFLLAALDYDPVRQELAARDLDVQLIEEIVSQDLMGSLRLTGDIPLAAETKRMVGAVLGAAASLLLDASIPD